MTKKAFIKILGIIMVFCLVFQGGPAVFGEGNPYLPPDGEGWNQLRDLGLITDGSSVGGWGSGLENGTNYSYLPVESEKYNNMSVVRFKSTESKWVANIAISGWETMDVQSYYEHGTLDFYVKGAAGGEKFKIGLRDNIAERIVDGKILIGDDGSLRTSLIQTIDVSKYATITKEWQHVSIPLKDMIDPASHFDMRFVQLLTVESVDSTPVTMWLNNVKLKSPDRERSYSFYKVNQVGYLTKGEKYAIVSGYYNEMTADIGTEFEVKKSDDNSTAFTGKLSLITAYDTSSGDKVLKAEFTGLTEPGRYYITVSGLKEKSLQFEIRDDVYNNLLADAQRYYYYQRAAEKLLPEHAGTFAREALCPEDLSLPLESNPEIRKNVSSGWFDAGDFGKYVNATATTVTDLLWSYEMFPKSFADGQNNIPESGNGIPDFLDEIKHATDYLLTMQDETGGFYNLVNGLGKDRKIENGKNNVKPTAQTADVVGALANASVVYKQNDKTKAYADQLLAAAERGWAYLEQHPEFINQTSGPYGASDDKRNRFYAAAGLYKATGEAKYNTYVLNAYKQFEDSFNGTGGSGSLTPYLLYMSANNPAQEVKDWFSPKFAKWRQTVIENGKKAVWRNSSMDSFYWGCNSQILGVNIGLAVGSKLLGTFDQEVVNNANGSLNYILGVNPLQLSYVVGYGENSIPLTFSGIYCNDGIIGHPKGYVAGGANQYNAGNLSRFPGKCYTSSTTNWSTNENCLNYESPLVFVSALLAAQGASDQAVSPKAPVFKDLEGHWAKADIENAAAMNIVNGMTDDSFYPDATVTRAQFAAMLVKALKLEASASKAARFDDVAADAWYAEAVKAAEEAGIVKGTGESTFDPEANITREQMALMLMRAYEHKTGKAYEASTEIAFADAKQISDWAKSAVQGACELKLMQGMSENSFAPADEATRAQAAAILLRLLNVK